MKSQEPDTRRKQGDLFDANLGRHLKSLGRELVESGSLRAVVAMRRFAKAYAARHGSVSIVEVRAWADRRGLAVHHPNAFGAVFKGREWVRVDWQRNLRPSAHDRQVGVWTLAN